MSTAQWREETGRLVFTLDGTPYFEDSVEHWVNAVCRLVFDSDRLARSFVERTGQFAAASCGPLRGAPVEEAVEPLRRAAFETLGAPPELAFDPGAHIELTGLTLHADSLWAPAVHDDAGLAVIGDSVSGHGWLVDRRTMTPPAADNSMYSEEYFEGGIDGVGYGACLEQSDWRLEKAARQVRQVAALGSYYSADFPAKPRVLDVGCGYGFFRHAARQQGWDDHGTEISAHAAAQAKRLFGLDTYRIHLHELAGDFAGSFDVITMLDFIEHVGDPVQVALDAATLLRPGGVLFARTPNLFALEREVFAHHYHSLKREHLQYFSPKSLTRVLNEAGFAVPFVQTDSHLLRGFLGGTLDVVDRSLRGCDITAVARRR